MLGFTQLTHPISIFVGLLILKIFESVIISASVDGTICTWSNTTVNTNLPLQVLTVNPSITSMTVDALEGTIYASLGDGSVNIWEMIVRLTLYGNSLFI
jgi:hypothetical protein